MLVVVNSMLKFALTILKKILPTVKLLNQTPSLPSKKLLLLLQALFAWLNHPTSTTESTLKLPHFILILLMPLKKVKSQPRMMLNQELNSSVKSSNGTKMMPSRSGVSVLIMLVVTSLLKRLQVSNISENLENPWKVPGNGLPRKLLCVKKIWEVSVLTFLIVSFMLMPSTEEVVKLSPPLESSTMLVNLLLNQPFKNLFSLLKLLLQLMLWVVFITVLTPEEVLLMRRNKLQELHSTSYDYYSFLKLIL